MASRYQTSKQIKDKYNNRKVSTVIIPVVPETSLWWIIASTNGLGKGTLIVPENTLLRIPAQSGIQDLISTVNKER